MQISLTTKTLLIIYYRSQEAASGTERCLKPKRYLPIRKTKQRPEFNFLMKGLLHYWKIYITTGQTSFILRHRPHNGFCFHNQGATTGSWFCLRLVVYFHKPASLSPVCVHLSRLQRHSSLVTAELTHTQKEKKTASQTAVSIIGRPRHNRTHSSIYLI